MRPSRLFLQCNLRKVLQHRVRSDGKNSRHCLRLSTCRLQGAHRLAGGVQIVIDSLYSGYRFAVTIRAAESVYRRPRSEEFQVLAGVAFKIHPAPFLIKDTNKGVSISQNRPHGPSLRSDYPARKKGNL